MDLVWPVKRRLSHYYYQFIFLPGQYRYYFFYYPVSQNKLISGNESWLDDYHLKNLCI